MTTVVRTVIAIVLCFALMFGSVACNSADVTKAVSEIAAYLPVIISLAQSAASIYSAFSPQDAAAVKAVMDKVQAGGGELQALCVSYNAKPDQGVWKQIIAVVDDLVASGDQALLNAAQISNSDSRQKALIILASVSAALHTIDAIVSTAQPVAAVKAKNAARGVKLRAVMSYWSQQDRQNFTAHTGLTPEQALHYATGM